jgi:hypothetical protein
MQMPNNDRTSSFATRLARPRLSAAVVVVMTVALLSLLAEAAHAATTYVVQQGGSCSDTGQGTSSTPFCTITAAAKKALSGDVVQVGAGTYREQVAVPSGVTFRTTAGAVLLGTDDYSSATWVAAGPGTWTTTVPGVVVPSQVFIGSTTLTKVTGPPTTTNTWSWDVTTRALSVNTGGPSPSAIEVSTRQYGFVLGSATVGVTGATVDGFTLRRQGGAGVYLRAGTSGSTVRNVSATQSGAYGVNDEGGNGNTFRDVHTFANVSIGIRISNATGDLVVSSTTDHNGFHGVSVQGGSSNSVRGVVASANKRPGTRVAAGIDVSASSVGALVEASTAYDNDDSGIEIYTGSSTAVVRRNLTYRNGDHGIDISKVTNSDVVSNTVVANQTSGINVEGISTGTTIRDNIAVDNTLDPTRSVGDIRIESGSEPGTTLDRDLVYESSAGGIVAEWHGVNYTAAQFATFRAVSGQESTGIAADPKFVGRSTYDLRLQGTSPAIDRADSGTPHWRAADLDGNSPVDDPKVPDFRPGSIADLGALEFRGAIAVPPLASPSSTDGLTYAVDARGSGTLGEAASGFTVQCGNGTTRTTPQAVCTYPGPGTYTIRVSVTGRVVGGTSFTDTATTQVNVLQDAPPTAVLTLSSSQVQTGVPVTADGSGSSDDRQITSYRFSCGDGGPDRVGTSAQTSCTYATVGTHTVTLTVTDAKGQTGTATKSVAVVAVVPPAVTVAPASAPIARLTLSRYRVRRGKPVVANAARSSSGIVGSPVQAYRFSCGGTRTRWSTSARVVCRFRKAGRHVVRVWVRNTAGLVDSTTRTVRVRR